MLPTNCPLLLRRVLHHMIINMAAPPMYIPAKEVEELLEYKELLQTLEVAFGNFSLGQDGGVVQPVRSVIEVTPHKG